jgi:hypothetical protein
MLHLLSRSGGPVWKHSLERSDQERHGVEPGLGRASRRSGEDLGHVLVEGIELLELLAVQ